MRHLIAALTLSASALFAAPSFAADSNTLCPVYGKIGGAMTGFMLPLTVQDMINMMSGKDPALMNDMSQALIESLTKEDLIAVSKLPGDDGGIIGEAAGQVAMELLMSGAANSGADVERIMVNRCKSIGVDTIIANQKRARAAVNANTGQ